MKNVFASIITIGDELLIGQVVDTNSSWIGVHLNQIGIAVRHRIAVADNAQEIKNALDRESETADIILITGGLGPTSDDITKPVLCEYFGAKMIVSEQWLNHLEIYFRDVLKKPTPISERNRKQAEIPDKCLLLKNEKGTAPGMLFEKDHKIYVSMPGVPAEMQWLMENQVIPFIADRFQSGSIEHLTMITEGIGESYLADKLTLFEKQLPSHIHLAYLPNFGQVRLRLTGFSKDQKSLKEEIQRNADLLKSYIKEYIISEEDLPMEEILGKLLNKSQKTFSCAESCTGGYIAHLMTSIPGASTYFMGGVVSYTNRVKHEILGVRQETLQTYTEVSEQTAREMVLGVKQKLHTDYAVAVTGIMGPDGGTNENPVGSVWIAAASEKETIVKKFNFRFGRKRNITLTAVNALNMARKLIAKEENNA